jgi:hypothetical protein
MRRTRYFDKAGEECSSQQALRDGVLRDGFAIRVPTIFADAASRFTDARSYWDRNKAALLVTDARRIGGSEGNKPGFRVLDAPINRQAVHDAHTAYIRDLENAFKTPPTGAGAHGFIGQRSGEGQPCTCRNAEYPEYFGAPGHLRNGVCVPDRADAAPDEGRRECPACDGEGEINGKQCERCGGSGEIADDDDAADDLEAESQSDAMRRGDRRSVDQIAHEHRLRTDRQLADHATWLSEQWKTGK